MSGERKKTRMLKGDTIKCRKNKYRYGKGAEKEEWHSNNDKKKTRGTERENMKGK